MKDAASTKVKSFSTTSLEVVLKAKAGSVSVFLRLSAH
ncbi:hypothetical protein PTUN_a0716 [Pseudoalteromonas tunicata]|nr:hypothetical protein PTUN_a0716 [Pseudoalteromonas tunicata]